MSKNGGMSELKQLMNEKLKNRTEIKVDSPLAKYNYKGQLTCIVCGITIKNSVVWQSHIIKKTHLQNLERIKSQQQQLNASNERKPVEKQEVEPENNNKRKKDAPKGILKNIANYSSSDSEEDEIPAKKLKLEPLPQKDEPMDWTPASAKPDIMLPPPPKDDNALPEGFFDDPVADAKARKVEYLDKDQEQYDEFLKAIAEAEAESRHIIAEDNEESAVHTRIEQADEQMTLLKKFVNLAHTVEKKSKTKVSTNIKTESDESSDEEFGVVHWRAKKAR